MNFMQLRIIVIISCHTGWQYRWFTVDAQAGTLSYYLCDSSSSGSSSSNTAGIDDSLPPNIIGNAPRWQVGHTKY